MNKLSAFDRFVGELIDYAYGTTDTTGPHITRFKMYQSLSGIYQNYDGPETQVLSISNSRQLARILGLTTAKVFDAQFPEFSCESLPFDTNRFDFVVSDQVLEHVRGGLAGAGEELMRVLKPGGKFAHTSCFINQIHGAPSDYWRFTPAGISALFEDYAIECVADGWGSRLAQQVMDAGYRFRPVPDVPDNPIYALATNAEPDWPISVWVTGTRSDKLAPEPAAITRVPSAASRQSYVTSGESHELTIVAIVKNEGPYLLEWIAYHRAVGVSHFYIYDNESNDATSTILSTLSAAGLVSAIKWDSQPGQNKQVSAYNDAVRRFGRNCEWVAFLDADEFIVPLTTDSITKALLEYSEYVGVGIPWRVFGSSGRLQREPGWVQDRFRFASRVDAHPNRHVKTIARASTIEFANVHLTTNRGGSVVDLSGKEINYENRGFLPNVVSGKLQINHYFCKSKEEFDFKRLRGRAAVAPGDTDEYRPEGIFRSMDLNDEEDLAILRFRDKAEKEYTTLRRMFV